MSNQLNRFDAETRWPLPDEPNFARSHLCASGGNRKALSRYISQCIARLELRDSTLRQQRQHTAPQPVPESFKASSRGLKMSRKEYLQSQNRLFQQLTGEASYAAHSDAEATEDAQDRELMAGLGLYMAALDEKIYISADYTRAAIGMRDAAVRRKVDELVEQQQKEGDKALVRSLVELRDMYRDLWMQHSQLSNQRDALEIEAANLRYDQALQLGKVSKLQYATHCLGRKLVGAADLRRENDVLKQQLRQQEQQQEELQRRCESLQRRLDAQDALMQRMVSESDGKAPKDVEARIHELFRDVVRLTAANSYKNDKSDSKSTETKDKDDKSDSKDDKNDSKDDKNDKSDSKDSKDNKSDSKDNTKSKDTKDNTKSKDTKDNTKKDNAKSKDSKDNTKKDKTDSKDDSKEDPTEPNEETINKDTNADPLWELGTAFSLVETLRAQHDARLSQLIAAFAKQYRAREQELLARAASAELEKQVVLARFDKLEQERDACAKDLSFLEERTLSLVYLLKTARASLDAMD